MFYEIPTQRKFYSYNNPNSIKQVRPNSSYHFIVSPERKTTNNFYREYNISPMNFMIDYQTNISTSSHRNLNRMIGDKSKKSSTAVNWNKFNSNLNPSNNQINVNKRPQSSFSQRGQNQNINFYKDNPNQNNLYKGYYDNTRQNYNNNVNMKNINNNENYNNINFQNNNNLNNKTNLSNNISLNDKYLSPYYSPNNNNDNLKNFQKSNFNLNFQELNSISNSTKYHYLPPKTKQNQNKKTLILDLDETLVHSSFKFFPVQADIYLNIQVNNKIHIVNVLKRPYVHDFLKKMSNFYEIVIFTASNAHYANPLLDQLDINHNISHRLFREHCISMSGVYIKDLRRIGRDLKDTIILDNNPISYVVNKENGIPIKTWHFDKGDVELVKLIPLFEYLSKVDDVRNVIRKIVKGNEVDFREVSKLINGVSGKDDKIDKGNISNNNNNGNININIVNQQVSNVFVNEYKNNGNVNLNSNLMGSHNFTNMNNNNNNNMINRNIPVNVNTNSHKSLNPNFSNNQNNINVNKNTQSNTNLNNNNNNNNSNNNNNNNNKNIPINNKNYNINNFQNSSSNKNNINLNLQAKQQQQSKNSFKQYNPSNHIIQNPNSLNMSYANKQNTKNASPNSPMYFFYNKNSNDIQPITLKSNSSSNSNYFFNNNDDYYEQQQKLKNLNYFNQNHHSIERNRNISSVDLGNYNNFNENNLNFSSGNVRFRTPMRNSMQSNSNYYYNNLLNGMYGK